MPFFDDGVLIGRFRGEYYQWIAGRWQPKSGQTARAGVALPLSITRSPDGRGPAIIPPASFPGSKGRCTLSLHDNVDTTWLGSSDELYRGIEDLWVRFPTVGTPLFAAGRLSGVLVDGAGDLWFVLRNGDLTQLAHYTSRGRAPTLEWAQAPASTTSTAKVRLTCHVQNMQGQGLLRYRSDEGAWRQVPLASPQQEIVVENLPNGAHKVEVRVYDELLRSSQSLTCAFEVKRDYDAEVRDLIPLLGSSDFSQREAVARTLVSIGRPAAAALTAQKEKATPDQLWWIQAVLDEIGRQ